MLLVVMRTNLLFELLGRAWMKHIAALVCMPLLDPVLQKNVLHWSVWNTVGKILISSTDLGFFEMEN